MDFKQWSGVRAILELTRAICANAWAHKDLMLVPGRTYGDQNSLRMNMAELLMELSLVPYVYLNIAVHRCYTNHRTQ